MPCNSNFPSFESPATQLLPLLSATLRAAAAALMWQWLPSNTAAREAIGNSYGYDLVGKIVFFILCYMTLMRFSPYFSHFSSDFHAVVVVCDLQKLFLQMFYKNCRDGGFFRDGQKQEAKVFLLGLSSNSVHTFSLLLLLLVSTPVDFCQKLMKPEKITWFIGFETVNR
jgi:hypothetical protein